MTWYYKKGDRQMGPIDEAALAEMIREQYLGPGSLVWCKGMNEWQAVSQTELASFIPAKPPRDRPPGQTGNYPTLHSSSGQSGGYPIQETVYRTKVLRPIQGAEHLRPLDTGLVYPSAIPISPHVNLLNFFLPGLGQMILGQIGKGFLWFALALGFTFVSCGSAYPVVSVVAVIDGYMVASLLRSGCPVGKWSFFP